MQMVKKVGNSQKEWCSIAYARMDKTLKLCVHSEMRKKNLHTIEDVENILLNDFDRPKDAAQAFHQLRQFKYSLDDDPRDFVNEFNAKFKSISNAFPNDKMPVADEVWRDLIMDGLLRDIKVRLNGYLRGGMAQMFLDELEKERGYYNLSKVAKNSTMRPQLGQMPLHVLTISKCHFRVDGAKMVVVIQGRIILRNLLLTAVLTA